jgi:hypothetical protein
MKLIDETRDYMLADKIAKKGKPFEVSGEGQAKRLMERHETLQKFGDWSDSQKPEPEPEPMPEPADEEPEAVAEPEPEPEPEPEAAEEVAIYKGNGWYDFKGQSVHLKDIPRHVKIVRE